MSKQYDIVIAGGGVIGASCAYQLSKRRDLKIALIDSKRPATRRARRPAACGR
ncbi:2-octaprenyl-3-methyl-6-methoxy-1,4-benzoquinol hydroxylase [Chromobacterium violaceum]|uniref:2-octaprenyl-3-methyl-6-methoxy-1,4-benzoquinol hydroxylase n=1 Tax=Chromobacterium violaceum TaxID=536 RepID=A0A447TAN0_CHRVL|nr:2-octaprenyl-3-methyl-6-methoxy-1,4-benzoquinol hydroxylase [Chromobacterium violaceum]